MILDGFFIMKKAYGYKKRSISMAKVPYTHPRIINTFFEQADLKGKTIHLFATSSSTGIEGSIKELKETYPDMNISDGKRI